MGCPPRGNVEGERISNGSRFNANGAWCGEILEPVALFLARVPQWWGPGYEGSLIRGDAMRPMTGFLMQRAEQAAPETAVTLGSMAVPDLRQPDESIYRCASCQNYRRTFYLHAVPVGRIRCVAYYAVGRGRATAILQQFLGWIYRKDNTGTDNEPGNQLAGFDFKFKLEPTLGWPVSFYGQMIGEDESGYLPSANMFPEVSKATTAGVKMR